MHGMSLGPCRSCRLARHENYPRVGGGHPHYGVLADGEGETRAFYQQDLWHYTVGKMVDACQANGIKAFYGPVWRLSPTLKRARPSSAMPFCKAAWGAWSLHPTQVDIAKRVFSPDVEEVKFALRILEAMPDGTGAVMIDGKMQDDATWKQAKVIADLAKSGCRQRPANGSRIRPVEGVLHSFARHFRHGQLECCRNWVHVMDRV